MWVLEMREISYMKVNIFLRIVNGIGTMRSMNRAISDTSRRKTYVREVLAAAHIRLTKFELFAVQIRRKYC